MLPLLAFLLADPALALAEEIPLPCPTSDFVALQKEIPELRRWPFPSSTPPKDVVVSLTYQAESGTNTGLTQRHVHFSWKATLKSALKSAPSSREFPLALPPPWRGSVVVRYSPHVSPRAGSTCASGHVAISDENVTRIYWNGGSGTARLVLQRPGQPLLQREFPITEFSESASRITLLSDTSEHGIPAGIPLAVPIGNLQQALQTMKSADVADAEVVFASVGVDFVDAFTRIPGRLGHRLRFLLLRARTQNGPEAIPPKERAEAVRNIQEKFLSPQEQRELGAWKMYFGAASPLKKDNASVGSARLLVAADVDEVWIEGSPVFIRASGALPRVDVRVPPHGVRVWTTSLSASSTSSPSTSSTSPPFFVGRVHDTWAVLRPGHMYSVRDTFLSALNSSDRRECIRVETEDFSPQALKWREISGASIPWMMPSQTYQPSGSAAERAVVVVAMDDAPVFPRIPMVYSYTHPGIYQWKLSGRGSIALVLGDDPSLCGEPSNALSP